MSAKKKELKSGDVIEVGNSDALDSIVKDIHMYLELIKDIGHMKSGEEKKMHNHLRELHPEIKDWHTTYNHETKQITLITSKP